MAWNVEGDLAVLDWLSSEPDLILQEVVMTWIPAFAEDPSRFPATRVLSVAAPVYVTFVPMTTVGVKYLRADQFNTLKLIKLQTVRDL